MVVVIFAIQCLIALFLQLQYKPGDKKTTECNNIYYRHLCAVWFLLLDLNFGSRCCRFHC